MAENQQGGSILANPLLYVGVAVVVIGGYVLYSRSKPITMSIKAEMKDGAGGDKMANRTIVVDGQQIASGGSNASLMKEGTSPDIGTSAWRVESIKLGKKIKFIGYDKNNKKIAESNEITA